jgi:hypothetical protein
MPNKHIETILTSIGLPAEDVAAIVAVPEAEQEKFDASPYLSKVKTSYQTQLQNDPGFFNDLTLEKLPADVKKKLESGQYARATNVAKEKLAKALGFTPEEIKDLETDDYKALDFYIPALTEKWTKNKSGDKQLQQQLIDARKKIEEFDGLDEKLKVKYESESNQKISDVVFNAVVISELSSIPGLKISASDIAGTANSILKSKYAVERVGDFGIELRQKSNPQMKVLKDNSSQELTLKEAIQEIAVERGWAEKEEPVDPKTGKGKVKVEPEKGKLIMAPHLQKKINDKIATEAK